MIIDSRTPFAGFLYILNSRGSYRNVSSLRTADFAQSFNRSGGPRGLDALKFAPNNVAGSNSGRGVSNVVS